ncbi:hypothetical protein D0T84_22575, partial [Dysgonomonas sp. 521]|uniref:fibrobacter succinogenes major paralogous domain-containing protein n=1 Tax=Dysgonomonas sp. 521 TaxID=2302932 RepID=UPI001C86723B
TTGLTADALGNMKKTPKITCAASNACGTVTSDEYEVLVMLATLGQLSPIYVNAWSEAAVTAKILNKPDDIIRATYAHVNLGDEYELDPCKMLGDLYQWGRPKDGHQSRKPLSGTTNVRSTVAPPGHGNFIEAAFNWLSSNVNTLWGDGTDNYTMAKATANDPCPTGWKVPSRKQWSALAGGGVADGTPDPNTFGSTWTNLGPFTANSVSGYKLSDALYLPAAGYRYTDGLLSDTGSFSLYWSSSTIEVVGPAPTALMFTSSSVTTASIFNYSFGNIVRCIIE